MYIVAFIDQSKPIFDNLHHKSRVFAQVESLYCIFVIFPLFFTLFNTFTLKLFLLLQSEGLFIFLFTRPGVLVDFRCSILLPHLLYQEI